MLPLKDWAISLPQMLIDQYPEDLWLDYKRSQYLWSDDGIDKRKRADDLSKDVSSFLNSDGGSLVCGIREADGTEATGGAPTPLESFDSSIDGYAKGTITVTGGCKLPRSGG